QARNAADVLGALRHPQAITELTAAIDRFPDETNAAIARALGKIGSPDGLPGVQRLLTSSGPATKAAAIQAYFDLRGARDGSEVAPLLTDSDPAVRRRAAAVVGNFKVAGAESALENMLIHDGDPVVRRNAAWALGQIGSAAARNALQTAAGSDPVQ